MMNDFQNLTARRNAYLTIPEAADFLRVSQRTLYRWMREGRLKCFRVGNITRIALKDMTEFIHNHTENGVSDDQHPRHAPETECR